MSVFERIWYTWVILIIPISLFGWTFFDDPEEDHPILFNLMCAFIWLPIGIGFIGVLIWGIVQIWR